MTDELMFGIGEDRVARLVFNRPQARNALTFGMYERLAEICATIDADRSVRAMIVTGAGSDAFAAGTDIAQFRGLKTEADVLAYEALVDRALGALERCRVPTLAAVFGSCTGGGAGIAACCDLRIAAAGARIGFPVARTLGNCLSIASLARLSSLVGPAQIKELVFTARLMEAAEAKEIGFLSEVLPDAAALAKRAEELAALFAAHAPLTMQSTKEALRRVKDETIPRDGKDLVLKCYLSRDFREGVEAFLAKRKPVWQGE